MRLLLSVLIVLAATAAGAAPSKVVVTKSGPVLDDGIGNVRAFLGLPYAAPPVGPLRWRAPQPPASWTAPRDAKTHAAACPQPEDKLYKLTPPVQSEDCLYLNVWTPAQDHGPAPVMVWIHGGSNRMGAGSLAPYDGTALAGRGVVVVTSNYRLGMLGFFAHEALDGEGGGGNFAFMDQVAALAWVRDNIRAFGGDPDNVTVMGESAGGADILYLMTSPKARGLFQRAIVQSGGGWHRPAKREKFVASTKKKLAAGDIEASSADALRAVPAEKLVEAMLASGEGVGPYLDGSFVPEPPTAAFEAGREAAVPLIIGSNDWEANLIKGRDLGFVARALTWIPGVLGWYSGADGRQTTQELLFRDMTFGAGARWIAAKHSAHAPAWLYQFRHVRESRKGKVPGAMHADEVPFVLDNLEAAPKTFGEAGADDRALSSGLADCWTSFAREGKPACPLADWTPYTPANDAVLWIEDSVTVRRHPEGPVLDKVGGWFGPGAPLSF